MLIIRQRVTANAVGRAQATPKFLQTRHSGRFPCVTPNGTTPSTTGGSAPT
jgi:hypothetical protein